MSNSTYLYTTTDAEYRCLSTEQFLLEGTVCIPLIWLACYRRKNVAEILYEGAPQALPTPIASLPDAIVNLIDSETSLRLTLPSCQYLADYIAAFKAFLLSNSPPFIAIHAGEVFSLEDGNVARTLAILDSLGNGELIGQESLEYICDLRFSRPLPDPLFMLKGSSPPSDDYWNLAHALGQSARPEVRTPWEHGDA